MDVERDWLDLVASMLATPITALPEERLAMALTGTFDAVGCAFHMRPAAARVVQRIYPRNLLSEAEQAELIRLGAEQPSCHPLLHYYLTTGDTTPQQVSDVPPAFGGPRVQAPTGSAWERAVTAAGWVLDAEHGAGAEVAVLGGDVDRLAAHKPALHFQILSEVAGLFARGELQPPEVTAFPVARTTRQGLPPNAAKHMR